MTLRHTISATLIALLASSAAALDVRLREFHSTPIARPGHPDAPPVPTLTPRRAVANDTVAETSFGGAMSKLPGTDWGGEPSKLLLYPVAGTSGKDLAIPYFVDLDATELKRDFNCGDLTFNGHKGHDPYIRSFAEQEIGVPVFAVRDGVVIDVHDGEADQNTDNNPAAKANYVTLRHDQDHITQYVHLKRSSITVALGDRVTAGTQIALVGSSGASTAPHIHFETRFAGESYEPLAGPCRPGRNHFDMPVASANAAMLLGATFSRTSFEGMRPAPWLDAVPTGTFVRGPQTIYFRADLANVGASTRYSLSLAQPTGVSANVSSGTLSHYDASLSSVWWGIDVDLDWVGTWMLRLDVNEGRQSFVMPFTVVASSGAVVNRQPNPLSAEMEPIAIKAGDVPVCRVRRDGIADPDYDVVRYRYEWQVDGATVRDVTTAAQSDALARQHVTSGRSLTCTVTAFDGQLSSQPATANSFVRAGRRRAVTP